MNTTQRKAYLNHIVHARYSTTEVRFTTSRKFSSKRKRRLYVRNYVCAESVLLQAVSSVANVDIHVNCSATKD